MVESFATKNALEPCLPAVIQLRRELHRYPELSGEEQQTAQRIQAFFEPLRPDRVITDLGGHGVAFEFRGPTEGPTVVFRCELDALPIQEANHFQHRSLEEAVSHKCGHDGHMAIMAGFGCILSRARPRSGKVLLLFQPGEESGTGAAAVGGDKRFKALRADYIFALHNMPGYPFRSVVLRSGTFNCASRGMIIKLHGATSHAALPEQGNSPARPMCRIMNGLSALRRSTAPGRPFALATVVHCRLGEVAFGTSPGYAEVMATLRAESDQELETLAGEAEELIRRETAGRRLEYEIVWCEEYFANRNDEAACEIVKKAAAAAGVVLGELEAALRGGEDFAYFTRRIRGAMFILGAGEKHAGLHTADYDFPDELIPPGVELFWQISRQIQG